MENNQKYRHEFKYLVADTEIEMLKARLNGCVYLDRHAGKKGIYNISSIYFDDCFNSCFRENEDGTDPREKFRIRIYNHSDSRISLECKRKERGKTLKTACVISKEIADKLLRHENILINDEMPFLLKKICIEIKNRDLKPKVIVEYDRIPYVYANGNVRITFDKNLSSSGEISDFFKAEKIKRLVMPAGMHLMEVKYDEFLPDWIYNALMLENLQQTAYSKYYLCRKYYI